MSIGWEEKKRLLTALQDIKMHGVAGLNMATQEVLAGRTASRNLLLYTLCYYASREELQLVKGYYEAWAIADALTHSANDKQNMLKAVAEPAANVAIDCELYDIAHTILLESKPKLNSTQVLALLHKNELQFIKDIISLNVRVDGVNAWDQTRAKLKNTKRLHGKLPQFKDTTTVGDIVALGVHNGIDSSTLIDLCMECRHLEDRTGIDAWLKCHKEAEALQLFSNNCPTTSKSLRLALERHCAKYALAYTKRGALLQKSKSKIFRLLFEGLEKDRVDAELHTFILRHYIGSTDINNALAFATTIANIVSLAQIREYFSAFLNPIKIIVLLIELCTYFVRRHDSIRLQCKKLVNELVKMGLCLQAGIKEGEQMRWLLYDKDIDGRDVLSIIIEHNMIDFLANPLLETVANEIWYGPYQATSNLLYPTSYLLRLLSKGSTAHRGQDPELRLRPKLTHRNIEMMRAHTYEFEVWRASASFRFILLGCEYLALTIGLFAAELVLRERLLAMQDLELKAASAGRAMTPSEVADYYREAERVRDGAFVWDVMGISIVVTLARVGLVPMFKALTQRTLTLFGWETALNLTVLGSLLCLYMSLLDASLGIADLPKSGEEVIAKVKRVESNMPTSILVSIIMLCLGVRTAYMLRVSSLLGPLVSIIQAMARKMLEFGLFFFLILFIFALSATLLFSPTDPAFERIDRIILTLFQSSVGVFNLNPPNKYEVQGKVFYVVYVFVVNIMLLNLLIAMFNDIYSTMSSKRELLYLKQLISLRDLYQPHKTYQFMVSSYYIFDVLLSLLFLPVYPFLSPTQRQRLNRALLYAEYTFAFIFVCAAYIVLELLLLPLVYLISCYRKARLLTSSKGSIWRRIYIFLSFLLLGPFVLLWYVATDVYYCILHAYTHKPFKKKDKEAGDYLSESALQELIEGVGKYNEEEVNCEVVCQTIEQIFYRKDQRAVTQEFIASTGSRSGGTRRRLVWVIQYLALSHFVRRLATANKALNCINIRVLRELLTEFLHQWQLRQFLKRNTLVLNRRGRYRPQVYPDQSFTSISSKSQTIERFDIHERAEPNSTVLIKSIKLYDPLTFHSAISAYSNAKTSVVELVDEFACLKSKFTEVLAGVVRDASTAYERHHTLSE